MSFKAKTERAGKTLLKTIESLIENGIVVIDFISRLCRVEIQAAFGPLLHTLHAGSVRLACGDNLIVIKRVRVH